MPTLYQLKREHHSPGPVGGIRQFKLVEHGGGRGRIVHVGRRLGKPMEVALSELRCVSKSGRQATLERAAKKGHNKIVDRMLAEDPFLDPNGSRDCSIFSMLGLLPDGRAEKVIEVLLKHGADIHHQAFGCDHGAHWTPFWVAVHDGHIDHARRLLAHGASFDLRGQHPWQKASYTPLHLAASCGIWDMLAWLLDQPGCPRVDPQEILFEFRRRDDRVDPANYMTAWGGHGVQVPLLHLVASGGFNDRGRALRFVDWLLEAGEEWDGLDHNGETARQVAHRTSSGMRVIMDEKFAQMQGEAMGQGTKIALIGGGRGPRL